MLPPHFALLTDSALLSDWTTWAQQRGGEAGTIRELEGPTLIDSALRLVATNHAALADRQLAYAYRPLLLFDKRELYDWPVDVDAAFGEEVVSMCKHAVPDDNCETVKRASDLDQSFDYLRVDPRRFSAADRERSTHVAGSAYYYHAVHGTRGQTYLDYWWYLPYNLERLQRLLGHAGMHPLRHLLQPRRSTAVTGLPVALQPRWRGPLNARRR